MSVRSVRRTYLLGSSALLALIGLSDAAIAQAKLPEVEVTANRDETEAAPGDGYASGRDRASGGAADRRPNSWRRRTMPSTRAAAISTRPSVRHRARQPTPPSKRCRKAPTRRSRRCCCRRPACRRIRRRAVFFMSATIMPTCNSASTASCCPTASPASAAFSITDLIGTIALVTGALPAEFGMRTVGLVDITTRADVFNNSGSVEPLRRQPRHHHAELRIWRHLRQQLSRNVLARP